MYIIKAELISGLLLALSSESTMYIEVKTEEELKETYKNLKLNYEDKVKITVFSANEYTLDEEYIKEVDDFVHKYTFIEKYSNILSERNILIHLEDENNPNEITKEHLDNLYEFMKEILNEHNIIFDK